MKFKILAVIAIIALLFACGGKTPPAEKAADSTQAVLSVDSALLKIDLTQAPDWFGKSVRNMADSLLAPGYGKSRRREIAEEKAMLDAQSRMAEIMSAMNGNAAGHELTQIAPFTVVKKERVQRDKIWHVYVVLKKN